MRLFQRVVRSFDEGLVVAARCVCVFLIVLRSVDLLRPRVASFSCTSERANAKMSAALSSTPRVSVCPRVVVRVGPILCALWQPLVRATVATSAARAAASMASLCCGSHSSVRLTLAVRGSGRTSRALSQPLLPACEPPGGRAPGRLPLALVGEVPGRSRHAWDFVRVSHRSLLYF